MADVLMETGHYYSIDVEEELKEKIRLYESAALQYKRAGNIAEEAYACKMTGDCYHCWENMMKHSCI
ncbi:hypothetical protein [Chitinophaga pinensis]|uniref:HEPN domain-containing protein n=1 Tax=Chitinophaga pinensis TaxID=79329 RepID=A0A5C6LNW9_9BACT|nr:hypothetical protein [Chitinophaga pinensis]TWV96196.1 hypothetical protein FEF09_23710 [Chitinophaga pinensis]